MRSFWILGLIFVKFLGIRLFYGETENKCAFPGHCVLEQRVKALADGDSIGFTPGSKGSQGARLDQAHKPHLGQAIGSRRHLRSLTARHRMSAPMLRRQSAAFKKRRVIRWPL